MQEFASKVSLYFNPVLIWCIKKYISQKVYYGALRVVLAGTFFVTNGP